MAEPITADELSCPQCGYNLRDLHSDNCPECGLAIDRSTLGQSIIPWLHRKTIGKVRAFWRTVNLATFRPRSLAREMNCPAQFDEAVKFRRVVTIVALIPLGLLSNFLLVSAIADFGNLWSSNDRLGSVLQILFIIIFSIGLWVFLLSGTALASYFFHPKSLSVIRQNRAVAISYYSGAPLAYSIVTIPLAVLAAIYLMYIADPSISNQSQSPLLLKAAIALIGFLPLGVQAVAMIRVPVVLLGAATHCSGQRQIALTIFLPIAWFFLTIFLLITMAMCALIVLMILSLR
jgi:hypothetical protein